MLKNVIHTSDSYLNLSNTIFINSHNFLNSTAFVFVFRRPLNFRILGLT